MVLEVSDVVDVGIAPEVLKAIVLAFFLLEDVCHDVGIIQQDPLSVGFAFPTPDIKLGAFIDFVFDGCGDGIDLGVTTAATDDHKICKGVLDGAEVNDGNVSGFFLLHPPHNQLFDGFGVIDGGVFCHAVKVVLMPLGLVVVLVVNATSAAAAV